MHSQSMSNAIRSLAVSAMVAFGIPLTSFAAGSFSGVIQSLHVNYGLGDILLRATGTPVTIYGTGACSVFNEVETLNYLVYQRAARLISRRTN
jgi:hypothetical protein